MSAHNSKTEKGDFKSPRFKTAPIGWLSYHGRRIVFETLRAATLTAVHLFVKVEEYASLLFPEFRNYSGIRLAENIHRTNHRLHRLVSGEEPFEAHPLVSILGCLDGGIDYKRAVGWMANGHIDVTRIAGGAYEPGIIENLAFLTASHPIRLHIVTRHTACAAEELACHPEKARLYPHLWSGVAERKHYFNAFLAQPEILECLNPLVAIGFIDSLDPLTRVSLGIDAARQAAIREKLGKPLEREVVILPMVVDKRTKLFFVDTESSLYPILARVYPDEIQAMVKADREIARRRKLDLGKILAVREFAQPETCGCGGGRQLRRTKCVMLAGVPPRNQTDSKPAA